MNPEEFSWEEFIGQIADFVWAALSGIGIFTAIILAVWLADYLTGAMK